MTCIKIEETVNRRTCQTKTDEPPKNHTLTHLQLILPTPNQRTNNPTHLLTRIPLPKHLRVLAQIRMHHMLNAPRIRVTLVKRRELSTEGTSVRPEARTSFGDDVGGGGEEGVEEGGGGGEEERGGDEDVALGVVLGLVGGEICCGDHVVQYSTVYLPRQVWRSSEQWLIGRIIQSLSQTWEYAWRDALRSMKRVASCVTCVTSRDLQGW